MRLPVIIVNFKAYGEATGGNAVRLAQLCDAVAREHDVSIAVAPQYHDIAPVKDAVSLQVFAQHIDPVAKAGAFTGHAVAENLKEAGIVGTLINHSEKKMAEADIKKCIGIAKSVGIVSVCCAATPEETGSIAELAPDFIAIEPTELIGSGVSVSKAKPEVVTQSVDIVSARNSKVTVLCGAGITNGADISEALRLGTRGVLVASGVVKSPDPGKVLAEFANALKLG
ncbi:MAG: triose-phosphate isomerase [Candidatus Aenigmarchaeota archaeon]|nr:triose-phosphate isomerase [Candidatus Aenigmarchaeota archaeon]